jgi:hypothetical protein
MSQSAASGLTCPKCHGVMRTYERNGVHIDQCTDCRGIFLDRGELDRLIDAESSFYQPQGSAGSPSATAYDDPYRPGGGHHDRGYGGHHGKRKRGGFLGELFD